MRFNRGVRFLDDQKMFLKLELVRVITWPALRTFGEKWPAAAAPLREWHKITLASTWRNFADVKGTFGQTDQTKVKSGQTVCVFDIGGNKYRLIAFVSYAKGKVCILRMLTHKEYDKGKNRWSRYLFSKMKPSGARLEVVLQRSVDGAGAAPL